MTVATFPALSNADDPKARAVWFVTAEETLEALDAKIARMRREIRIYEGVKLSILHKRNQLVERYG